MAAEETHGQAGWHYPAAWEKHLLRTHPSAGRASSQMRRHAQLHSMRRDEGGNFNDLEGGRPRMLDGVLDDLQAGVEEERRAGRMREAACAPARPGVERIDPLAIETAIAEVKAASQKADPKKAPHLARAYEVLRYFQSPPGLRQFDADGFACQLDPATDKWGLYRLKKWACYAVWERLPLAERLKAEG